MVDDTLSLGMQVLGTQPAPAQQAEPKWDESNKLGNSQLKRFKPPIETSKFQSPYVILSTVKRRSS